MANFVQLRDDFGNAFSQSFGQARHYAERDAERKRQEEANASLMNAYLAMEEQRRQANLAPQINAATQTGNALQTAQGNLAALSAPITTSPDGLADTRGIRALLKDPAALANLGTNTEAPIDPAQLTAYNQSQAPALQAQVNQLAPQAQTAQDLLAEAEKRYSPSVLAKLAPMVSKGVPFEKLVVMANSIQAQDDARVKTQELNKAYKDVFTNKDLTDEQKAMMLLGIDPANPIGKMFAERAGRRIGPETFAPGSYVRQPDGSYKQIGQPTALVRSDRVKYTVITNADGSKDKVGDDGSVVRIAPATADKEPVGNLTPEEKAKHTILERRIKTFKSDKANQTITGAFDPDKAAEHPDYQMYLQWEEQFKALDNKALQPKTTKETSRVISPAQIMAIKSTLVTAAKQSNKPIPSDAEMDAYIKKNYTVTEETP